MSQLSQFQSLAFWMAPETVSDLREPALFQGVSPNRMQTRRDIQARLLTQVGTCSLSWAAAPELE